MKILSPIPRKRGRIEIIPLIDIMFFLLAAFMMVSIKKIEVKTLKVALPTDVPVSELETKEDFVSISLDAGGQVQIDKESIRDSNTLLSRLQQYYAKNKEQKFLISADKDARSGEMVTLLGKLRVAGFQHVAFNLKAGTGPASQSEAPGAPGTATTESPGSPLAPPASPGAAPASPAEPSAAAGSPVAPVAPTAPVEPSAAPSSPTAPASPSAGQTPPPPAAEPAPAAAAPPASPPAPAPHP